MRVFRSNALGGIVSAVSENFLCFFYPLRREFKLGKHSRLSKHVLKREVKFPWFCFHLFSFLIEISRGLTFNFEHHSEFSEIIDSFIRGSAKRGLNCSCFNFSVLKMNLQTEDSHVRER